MYVGVIFFRKVSTNLFLKPTVKFDLFFLATQSLLRELVIAEVKTDK